MGMPQTAAEGLLLSTIVVAIAALIFWSFKRPFTVHILIGPLVLVGIAFLLGALGQWANAGFFIDLMKIGSLVAFMWAVATLVLTLFSSRPARK
jgi:hypothetical protein